MSRVTDKSKVVIVTVSYLTEMIHVPCLRLSFAMNEDK